MLPLLAAASIISFGIGVVESYSAHRDAKNKPEGQNEFNLNMFPQVRAFMILLIANSVSLAIVILWIVVMTNKVNEWEQSMEEEMKTQERR